MARSLGAWAVPLWIALVATVAAPLARADAGWTPVRGLAPGMASGVVADGPRVLVLSGAQRNLYVTTIRDARVARRQLIVDHHHLGTVRQTRIVALPRGRSVVVWGNNNRVEASYRPSARARFMPPVVVSREPAAFARAPAVAVTGDGAVVAAWWGSGGLMDNLQGVWAADLQPDGEWSAPVMISAGVTPPGIAGPPVAAAASPDGGVAVVWRQVDPSPPPGSRVATIAGVLRSPDGTWGIPTPLGTGDIHSADLAVSSPAPGTLAAAWTEGRDPRPDGLTTSTCVVAAVAAPGGSPTRSDLACRNQYSGGRVRLVAAADGGLLVAWQSIPDFLDGSPLRSSIDLFWCAPGGTACAPSGLAVANTLGYWDLEDFAPLDGGGVVLADLSEPVGNREGRQIRAVVVRADGTIARRLRGPSPQLGPGDKRLFALSSNRHTAAVAQITGGYPYRTRLILSGRLQR